MAMRAAVVIILAFRLCLVCTGQGAASGSTGSRAATFDLTGTVHIYRDSSLKRSTQSMRGSERPVVVWLEPIDLLTVDPATLDPTTADRLTRDEAIPGTYKMVQKDKEFHPRLLVVPVGSTVSFPNADPYFHNVFSLFNGRRFDLGLYQSGQTRNVAFNREGVSYIFCNIHPEMSAVIISLKSPYYALSDAKGAITLHGVPDGLYRLGVWSELATPESLRSLSRNVKVDRNDTALGKIEIHVSSPGLEEHLNKFGQPYDTHSGESPY